MLVRKLTYLLGGVVIGCSASAAVFAWGAQTRAATVYCVPEGVKTAVICEIVERGPVWTQSSGYFLPPEAHPDFERLVGKECLERYHGYVSSVADTLKRNEEFAKDVFAKFKCTDGMNCAQRYKDYERTLSEWREMGTSNPDTPSLFAVSADGSRNMFMCHNWSVS